jgi:hypothetical protein
MTFAQYAWKIALTTALVLLVAETSKRSTLLGAVFASLPLVSVLAIVWLYQDTRDVAAVAALSRTIPWLVLPSLVLFIVLPWLLARGHGFYWSLAIGAVATVASYGAMLALQRFLSGPSTS